MGFYGDSVFDANKAVKEVSVEESSIIREYDEVLIEAYHEGLYSIQEAKYTFLPRFRKSEELKKYEEVARDADDVLDELDPYGDVSNGDRTLHKVGKVACRALDILWNIGSVMTLASCITIIGIPYHLLQRALVWAARTGNESAAANEADEILRKFRKIANGTKDPKVKERCEEQIRKIEESKRELRRNINNHTES